MGTGKHKMLKIMVHDFTTGESYERDMTLEEEAEIETAWQSLSEAQSVVA